MQNALSKVRDFHMAIYAAISERPMLLSCDVQHAQAVAAELRMLSQKCVSLARERGLLFGRLAMATEEMAEWVEAHVQGDLVAAADAWGDRQYVLLGDAVAAGLPVQEIFDEVHRSNMTKVRPPPNDVGKAKKGLDFQPPNFGLLLDQ